MKFQGSPYGGMKEGGADGMGWSSSTLPHSGYYSYDHSSLAAYG